MKIPVESKIDIYINGKKADTVIAASEVDIVSNQLMITRTHGLVSTNDVKMIRNEHYEIHSWLQDAVGINDDGYVFQSIGDID